jgi:hypothetical protein
MTVNVRDRRTIVESDVGVTTPHVSNQNQVAHLAVLNEIDGEARPD